jgi:hypothetical protein
VAAGVAPAGAADAVDEAVGVGAAAVGVELDPPPPPQAATVRPRRRGRRDVRRNERTDWVPRGCGVVLMTQILGHQPEIPLRTG